MFGGTFCRPGPGSGRFCRVARRQRLPGEGYQPSPGFAAYWNSDSNVWVDEFAIESAWTPSCCFVCSA